MTRDAPNPKFKICLVSISLAKGGAERSCAMLSQMLSGKGHGVHTVILTDEVDYPYTGELFNLGRLKGKNDIFLKRLLRFRRFREYLLAEDFDMVIDHRPKNNFLRELFYANYLYRNQQCIYVVHSSKRDEYLTSKPKAFKKIYNSNRVTVAVSRYIEQEFLNKAGIKNSVTIHNAFDPLWGESIAPFPSILENKNYILSYGRMDDAVKDFRFLIEAFMISEVWKKDIYLVLMGEGPDTKMLQEYAANLVCGDNIIFLSFTNEPFSIIKKARFVTLTSRYEGFPMILPESLSLGTPVVSLDIVSGPSEIISHRKNGLLIPGRNLSLFAEAIEEMCTNEELYNFCKANTKESVAAFSMETIAAKWDQLLENGVL